MNDLQFSGNDKKCAGDTRLTFPVIKHDIACTKEILWGIRTG